MFLFMLIENSIPYVDSLNNNQDICKKIRTKPVIVIKNDRNDHTDKYLFSSFLQL